jgi:hypothetical protein
VVQALRISFFMIVCGALIAPVFIVCVGVFTPHNLTPEQQLVEDSSDVVLLSTLAARVRKGEPPGRDLAPLIDAVLATQTGRVHDAVWTREAGELIEATRDRGLISDEHWNQYLMQGVDFRPEIVDPIRAGDPILLRYDLIPRLGPSAKLIIEYSVTSEIDQRYPTRETPVVHRETVSANAGGRGPWRGVPLSPQARGELKVGPHLLEITVAYKMYLPATSGEGPKLIGDSVLTANTSFRVLPPELPIKSLAYASADQAALSKAVGVRSLGCGRWHPTQIELDMTRVATPKPILFDVFLRSGDQLWEVGGNVAAAPPGITFGTKLIELDAARVDVVLRPSVDGDLNHAQPVTFQDAEVVFPAIPVIRPAGKP